MTFKIKISQFYDVHPNNGNETKSDISPWEILKYDIIFHLVAKF